MSPCLQLFVASLLLADAEAERTCLVDIGEPGDEEFIGEGFYHRETAHPDSGILLAARNSFRWTTNEFDLTIPVFPLEHNQLEVHMYVNGALRLETETGWKKVIFGTGNSQTEYRVLIPAENVGDATRVTLRGSALTPRVPPETDSRILFVLLERVVISPVEEIPEEAFLYPVPENADIPTLDRIRGVERRPVSSHVEEFVQRLVAERANVATIGAMYGTGQLFFPSEFGEAHPQMDPEWLPTVIRELRSNNIRPLCWVVFNAQDLRDIDAFVRAKNHPEWRMEYIEDGQEHPPKVGMCVVSSPYIDWYAKVLREVAAFDLDGFFFDGFYLGGIPHPARPGCVCTFCKEAFAQDTGLDLPEKVDWTDPAFKRWVRWRNDRILKTARRFQAEIQGVNPDVTCTFNYNIWPFARKDWETAIPMWRIEDLGVSQHGYTPDFHMKWMMLGFKCRIGRDMNPAHTDIWRACGFQHTCGGGEPDMDWHELEVKTFILGALSHGITPWHSTIAGPVELTARIHADAARRERYFSRDHVARVGVLCSQNTHDFYGHNPGTSNLTDYQDTIIGTWMVLSENHIPFEYVFDNQIESAIPEPYQVLILPNAAALSEKATNNLAAWVRQGGRLIATAKTGSYNEWGDPLEISHLETVFRMRFGDRVAKKRFGRGWMFWLPEDSGLSYCRTHDSEAGESLAALIPGTALPFTVKAPPWLTVNMFRSPDSRELWVHLLNVSHMMPEGDSGFRGLDQPAVPVGRAATETAAPPRRHVGEPLVPVRDIRFRLREGKADSARLVVAEETLPLRRRQEVVIPEVGLHEVLVLELRQ